MLLRKPVNRVLPGLPGFLVFRLMRPWCVPDDEFDGERQSDVRVWRLAQRRPPASSGDERASLIPRSIARTPPRLCIAGPAPAKEGGDLQAQAVLGLQPLPPLVRALRASAPGALTVVSIAPPPPPAP